MDSGKVGSGMIFYPSGPQSEEWRKLAGSAPGAVVLEGTAAEKGVGQQIGQYDLYEGEEAYMFSMCLPGVDFNSPTFGYRVKPSGEVTLTGHTITGSTHYPTHRKKVNILVNNLAASGMFSVSFKLPGKVKTDSMKTYSHNDGILWGVVYKQEGRERCSQDLALIDCFCCFTEFVLEF